MFLWNPVIKDNSLEAARKILGERDKSLPVTHSSFGITLRASEIFDHLVSKCGCNTGIKTDRGTLFSICRHGYSQQEAMVLNFVILNALTLLALQSLLNFVIKGI